MNRETWRLQSLQRVFLLFLASRCLIFFALVNRTYPYADQQAKLDHPLLDPFILYDSFNYVHIAMQGYDEERLTAFFPLYPLVVKAMVGLTGLDVYWIGFVLSNVFFILSLWLLDGLLEKRMYSLKSRMIILLILVLFPSSYYFSAFYTESFFFFLSICAFRLWDKDKKGWAYLVGSLAATTRIVGACLPLAFFLDRMMNRKLEWKDYLYSFCTFLVFLTYPLYLWLEKGDPLIFLKVQSVYYHRFSVPPLYPIYQDIVWIIERLVNEYWLDPITVFHMVLFTVSVFYIKNTLLAFRKGQSINWAEFFFTIGLTVIPLSSMLYIPLKIATHGYMRYILPIFPLFMYMGQSLEAMLFRASSLRETKKRIKVKCILWLILTGWIIVSLYIWYGLTLKAFLA